MMLLFLLVAYRLKIICSWGRYAQNYKKIYFEIFAGWVASLKILKKFISKIIKPCGRNIFL